MGYGTTVLVGSSYVASDTLLVANDAEKAITWAAYALTKEIVFVKDVYPRTSLRFKFDLKAVGGGHMVYGKIYKNGVAVSAAINTNNPAYETQTIDVSFTNLSANDRLQLYTYDETSNGSCQNFRILGNESPFYSTVV